MLMFDNIIHNSPPPTPLKATSPRKGVADRIYNNF